MAIKFISKTVYFNGISPSDDGQIRTTASVDFPTNVTNLVAVLQSFKLSYDHMRYVHAASAVIENVSHSGTTATCNVSLQIYESSDYRIDPSASYAVIVFIADCQ